MTAHQAGELRLGQAAVIDPLGDDRALAHDRDTAGQRQDFAELVADEDDAHAAGRHGAQRPEKAFGLARRQRGGRLVEDENARPAHQRLGDLDPLLLAERQVADQRLRIQRDVKVAADGREAVEHRAARQAPVGSRPAHEQVLEHRMARHQLEMLVHHADAEPERVGGAADGRRPAVDLDETLVGGIGAEEDIHQAGLAGAVLAEEAEDVAGVEGEVNAGTRGHRAEALGDAAHGDQRNGVAHGRPVDWICARQPPTSSFRRKPESIAPPVTWEHPSSGPRLSPG